MYNPNPPFVRYRKGQDVGKGAKLDAGADQKAVVTVLPHSETHKTQTHCFVAPGTASKVDRSPPFAGSGPCKQVPVVSTLKQVLRGSKIAS